MPIYCKNCDAEFDEGYRHCPNCGQKANTHRLNWHDVQHDITHYFTHADKGIFFLLNELAVRTGAVAREYLYGKRKKYMSPVTFYLLASALYVLAIKGYSHYFPSVMDVMKEPGPKADVFEIRSFKANQFSQHNLKMFSFLAIPITAFVFWLYYRKFRINYVEQIVTAMYCNGFTLLVMSYIFMPLGLLLFKDYNSKYVLMGGLLFQLIYYSIFYYHFGGEYSGRAKIRAFAASLTSLIVWIFLVFMLVSLYVATGFFGLLK